MDPTPGSKKNVLDNSETKADANVHIGDKITYSSNRQSVVIPRLLTNLVPSNAEHIIGRDTEVDLISKHLAQNKPTVLVNGIGGIGKTSVATKYVVNFGKNYKHIAWLTVQSSLAETFTNDDVF